MIMGRTEEMGVLGGRKKSLLFLEVWGEGEEGLNGKSAEGPKHGGEDTSPGLGVNDKQKMDVITNKPCNLIFLYL